MRHRLWFLTGSVLVLPALLFGCSTALPPAAPTYPPPATVTTSPVPLPSPSPDLPPSPGSPCYAKSAEKLLPTPAVSDAQIRTPLAPMLTVTPQQPVYLSKRAGFGMSVQVAPEAWANELHSGWYLSWQVKLRGPDQLPQHWQMVRLKSDCYYPSEAYIRWTASHYPGNVWMIGNEPDVIWQDNITPEEYARQYGQLYQIIRSADPTAQLAPANISQATPLRLAYLDRVLQAYHSLFGSDLPAQWWTVHGFVLREQSKSWGVEIPPGLDVQSGELREVADHDSLELFKQQLQAFRQWMNKNGYREVPLALTEFGILMPEEYGFSLDQVTAYMDATFTWLQNSRDPETGYPADDNRLVQRWAWFSLADPLYPAPNLADLEKGALSPLGQAFRNYVDTYQP